MSVELLKEHAGKIWEDQGWQMDVTTDTGLILFVIHISAVRAPVMGGTSPKLPAR